VKSITDFAVGDALYTENNSQSTDLRQLRSAFGSESPSSSSGRHIGKKSESSENKSSRPISHQTTSDSHGNIAQQKATSTPQAQEVLVTPNPKDNFIHFHHERPFKKTIQETLQNFT
ncbi:unnamed protein product, partial [Owenia fusiformis]